MKIEAKLTQRLANQIAQDIDAEILYALSQLNGYFITELSGSWQKELVREFDQFWVAGRLYIPKRHIRLSSYFLASDFLYVKENPVLLFLGVRPRTLTKEHPNKNLDFYFLYGEKVIYFVGDNMPMKNLFTHVKAKS